MVSVRVRVGVRVVVRVGVRVRVRVRVRAYRQPVDLVERAVRRLVLESSGDLPPLRPRREVGRLEQRAEGGDALLAQRLALRLLLPLERECVPVRGRSARRRQPTSPRY
jgi:hypothetical protein